MLTVSNYNPDVLSCLANLSNDEVFTPPQLCNQILDLLPTKIWSDRMSDSSIRFASPVCSCGRYQSGSWLGWKSPCRTSRKEQTTFSQTSFLVLLSRS